VKACFIDCTAELDALFANGTLNIPEGVSVNVGDPTSDEIIRLCRDVDVLMVEHTVITADVLEQCKTLKAIVFMGTGAGTYVDASDANARGIQVLTTPGYGNVAVAEHAFALMLSGARDIARMDKEVREGTWIPRGGMQLRDRQVAVIGMGGIGQTFAGLCSAIGMQVKGWNRRQLDHPAYCADLEEALREADVVSVHLALTPETEGFLNRSRLLLPKKGFMLVNTARAELIDEAAMLELLNDGVIGHVATDVFNQEPVAQNDPLLTCEHTTLTAHAAYMTQDAYIELWKRTIAQFRSVEAATH